MTVDWYHVSDSWDGPLKGWVRVRGSRYYFDLSSDIEVDTEREYHVYRVDRPTQLAHMMHLRMWRRMVGWHSERVRGKYWPNFTSSTHPDWMDFYKLPKPPPLDDLQLVGTTDLRTVSFVPNAMASAA